MQDNLDWGNLKSWGYNHTLALLESIEDEEALKNVVNEPYVLEMRQTYPLYHAQDKGNTELVRILLEFGADPLKQYGPRKFLWCGQERLVGGEDDALHVAIFFHRVDVVKAITQLVEDKKMLAKYLTFAKSQLASGWYMNNEKGQADFKNIIQLLS